MNDMSSRYTIDIPLVLICSMHLQIEGYTRSWYHWVIHGALIYRWTTLQIHYMTKFTCVNAWSNVRRMLIIFIFNISLIHKFNLYLPFYIDDYYDFYMYMIQIVENVIKEILGTYINIFYKFCDLISPRTQCFAWMSFAIS